MRISTGERLRNLVYCYNSLKEIRSIPSSIGRREVFVHGDELASERSFKIRSHTEISAIFLDCSNVLNVKGDHTACTEIG